MWTYNKILEYPVNIKCTDARLAKVIISQYGGPDGELAASLRYLSQRFGMPDQKSKAILNDIRNRRISPLRNGRNYSTPINKRSFNRRNRTSRIRCILYRPWGGSVIYPNPACLILLYLQIIYYIIFHNSLFQHHRV